MRVEGLQYMGDYRVRIREIDPLNPIGLRLYSLPGRIQKLGIGHGHVGSVLDDADRVESARRLGKPYPSL